MTPPVSRRQQTHDATLEEIKAAAKSLMASQGSAAIGLRAVAREIGIAPSALYRYVDSRDDLLTELIVDSFDAVGAAVERAAARLSGDGGLEDFMTVVGAFRTWCLKNPVDFALIYGSPIPGYEAPKSRTHQPSMRVPVVLLSLLTREVDAGRVSLPTTLAPTLERGMRAVARGEDSKFAGFEADATSVALATWSTLLGAVSNEVFGHFPLEVRGKVGDELFRFTMRRHMEGFGFQP